MGCFLCALQDYLSLSFLYSHEFMNSLKLDLNIYMTILLDFRKHRTVSKTLLILVIPGLQDKESNYCLYFFKFYGMKLFPIYSVIRWDFLPKQSQRSRFILLDGSRSFGWLEREKKHFIIELHKIHLNTFGNFETVTCPL